MPSLADSGIFQLLIAEPAASQLTVWVNSVPLSLWRMTSLFGNAVGLEGEKPLLFRVRLMFHRDGLPEAEKTAIKNAVNL